MEREWFNDPNGFSGRHYLELYADRLTPKRTRKEVAALIRLVGVNERTAFLDMPCGHGRHSIELGRRGYSVTGVDIHPDLLAIARRTARAYRLENITFLEGDMRTWQLHETFDVALSLYVGFGYFKSDEMDDQVLRNIHASLKPGGKLMIDYLNAPRVINDHASGPRQTEWSLSSGKVVFTRSSLSDDQQYWITTHVVNGDDRSFSLRLYTPKELEQKLRAAGFTVSAQYGDFDQTALNAASPRVLLIAKKL